MHSTGRHRVIGTSRNMLVVREYARTRIRWSVLCDVRNAIVAQQPAHKEQLGQEIIFHTIIDFNAVDVLMVCG